MKFKKILFAIMITSFISASMPAYAADGHHEIKSVTRLDSKNVIVMWEGDGSEYNVYRSENEDGNYSLIGTSKGSSFRDEKAESGNFYYYKIAPANVQNKSTFSKPAAAETNPQKIDSVPVIMYHNFVTKQDIENGVKFDEYSLAPEDFEADLKYLRENGYTTITSKDLLEYLHGNKPLPQKAIIISIDDGSWGVYTNAYPLLKKYYCKADFNIIGEKIDETWQLLHDGGIRQGLEAPYCTWDELIEMSKSGVINLCSHTYGRHRYSESGRKGINQMDGESEESYINMIKKDFDLVTKSLTGWTDIVPGTMTYPYSHRSSFTDKALLENTSYEILMGGANARGTANNYFVRGADSDSQIKLMSRPCRQTGTPISKYLETIYETDSASGIWQEPDYKQIDNQECKNIASAYSIFSDVETKSWYSSPVYYTYLNGILSGTSESAFSPDKNIDNAMVATILYRMFGSPAINNAENVWYGAPMKWAETCSILPEGSNPQSELSREDFMQALFHYAKYTGMDISKQDSLNGFKDTADISQNAIEAMKWAVAEKLIQGYENNCLNPHDHITRAQLAVILQNWNLNH